MGEHALGAQRRRLGVELGGEGVGQPVAAAFGAAAAQRRHQVVELRQDGQRHRRRDNLDRQPKTGDGGDGRGQSVTDGAADIVPAVGDRIGLAIAGVGVLRVELNRERPEAGFGYLEPVGIDQFDPAAEKIADEAGGQFAGHPGELDLDADHPWLAFLGV